ncbi:MAG: FadR family transcriptional regulator [Geminicoccaceae bacterium]|nr:FadR family transcriptional regulator [Geminicoccaceae bacterium]MCB9945896.1 FadR family transcriptional regulator [Geminicoccaceae bacterium]
MTAVNPHPTCPTGADRRPSEPTLGDHVHEQLLDRIRAGVYPLDSRLPSEIDLAAEFEVSRPIVRSALARLREEGLVVSRRGSGSFVASSSETGTGGYMQLKSVEDIAAWYEFRRMIESETAARAASRASGDDVARLEAIALEMERTLDEGRSGVEVDIRFHDAIAAIADNRFLHQTVIMIRPHLYFIARFVRSLGQMGYLTGQIEARGEHRAIIAAIRAGDADAARRAMVDHVDGSHRRVFKGE